MCAEWEESFYSFIDDMGKRPSTDYSIERINNDDGYHPENCKWILKSEQYKNRRGTRFITFNGETLNHTEWSRKLGLADNVVAHRIKSGWSEKLAVTTKNSSSKVNVAATDKAYKRGFNAAIDEAVKVADREAGQRLSDVELSANDIAAEIKELKQ